MLSKVLNPVFLRRGTGLSDGLMAFGILCSGTEGGLSYVPFDGYIAELHKGERVLTAREADEYRKNGVQGGTGFVVNQTIYAAKQTPVELAAATRAAFQRARWATV